MDPNAYRDDDETDQPETYWRRRAATLAAGLGLLGLLAWAFSSGGGKPGAPAARSSPPSGALSAAAYPGASASSLPSSVSASASAGASAAVPGLTSPGTSGLPTASSSANSKSARSTARATATASAKPGGRCSSGSVVLSLVSSSRSYPAGQDPEFGVDAVSTAPGTCTFDLGPARLHLVVMSAGRVVWDSADCLRGGAAQLSRLTRGVPVEESFTWNRAITLPGCVTLASSARPGSYEAQARAATVTSRLYSFRLAR